MNVRHNGRRYSDLLYRMISIVGMAAAVAMAALLTAWVALPAKAAGPPTGTVTVGPITVCVDGTCTTMKDVESTEVASGGTNVAGVIACAYGEIAGTGNPCVAVPVAPGWGYIPPGWQSPILAPATNAGTANTGQAAATWYGAGSCVVGALTSGTFTNGPDAHEENARQYLKCFPTLSGATSVGCGSSGAGQTVLKTKTGAGAYGSCFSSGYYVVSQTCGAGLIRSVDTATCVAAYTCPTGYGTLSTGGCAMTEAANQPRPVDGKCNVVRTGNTYAGDSLDADCSLAGIAVSSTSVSVSKTEGDKTVVGKVEATAGGGTKVSDIRSDAGSNRSESKVVVVGPTGAGGGAVTGRINSTGSGAGDAIVADTVVSTPGGFGGGGEIDFPEIPTDYNRETTQQAILAKLSPTSDDLDGAVDSLDAAADARISAFDGATGAHGITLSFSPILPSPSCSFPAFTIAGHSMDMTSWCPRIETLRQLFGLALYIGTAFMLYDIFTRSA